jgi:hypothetical protein
MGVLLEIKMAAKKGHAACCQAFFHSPITTFSPQAPRVRLLEQQLARWHYRSEML